MIPMCEVFDAYESVKYIFSPGRGRRIVLNLIKLKGLPFKPGLLCIKKIGFPICIYSYYYY